MFEMPEPAAFEPELLEPIDLSTFEEPEPTDELLSAALEDQADLLAQLAPFAGAIGDAHGNFGASLSDLANLDGDVEDIVGAGSGAHTNSDADDAASASSHAGDGAGDDADALTRPLADLQDIIDKVLSVDYSDITTRAAELGDYLDNPPPDPDDGSGHPGDDTKGPGAGTYSNTYVTNNYYTIVTGRDGGTDPDRSRTGGSLPNTPPPPGPDQPPPPGPDSEPPPVEVLAYDAPSPEELDVRGSSGDGVADVDTGGRDV
jgi:hypothetical protein